MSDPLVTVNILSFNRKDELDNTLKKVFSQEYKNIEVIVVDNGSSDGTCSMVNEKYPTVRLIPMEKNIGIAAWNEGFAAAKGEYVLVLDDNAYPKDDAIVKAVKAFRDDAQNIIACIAFNIYDLRTESYWQSVWQPKERSTRSFYPVFVGCAFMLDAKKMELRSLMPEHYFLYQNELAISAKIDTAGYRILYDPGIVGYHWFFDNTMYNKQKDQLIFQNNLFFILENLPLFLSMIYSIQCLLYFFLRAGRRKWLREYTGISKKVLSSFTVNRSVSLKYFFALRRLHIFNFTLFSKVNFFSLVVRPR